MEAKPQTPIRIEIASSYGCALAALNEYWRSLPADSSPELKELITTAIHQLEAGVPTIQQLISLMSKEDEKLGHLASLAD